MMRTHDKANEKLIFEYSHPGRGATDQWPQPLPATATSDLPQRLLRTKPPLLPEVGELEAVRHFTRLSQLNFSIDTHFYPLGSCTMKYNPKACNQYAMLPEFLGRHPLAPESHGQGFLACMYELQEMLKEVTGMQGVALSPMAGAHGEFAGVAMIRAYHRSRGDLARNEIIVPEAAHGTNPATATMCGCIVREIPVNDEGDIELDALRAAVGPNTAGIMLTNPSTLGVFERRIEEVARIGSGYLYYVSLRGVTGASHIDLLDVAARIPKIRAATHLPIGVGFGIRDAESARRVAETADAVVIGSRIIQEIESAGPHDAISRVKAFLKPIRQALDA